METSEGESVPFTKKELEELPFYEHVVHAEIHNEPMNRMNDNNNANTLPELSETEDDNENTLSEEEDENEIEPLLLESSDSHIDEDLSTSPISIPPNLLQIINNLAEDYEDDEINQNETLHEENCEDSIPIAEDNENNDQITDDDDSGEENEDEEGDNSDRDVDATYNELDTNDPTPEIERQIIT
ncbi:nucleolin-like, partial [Temnothorax curvispinosus]|uniref:Nucleolin-like n=1 Tax=Temnothorax curvispinosus TaxID=300111 RepID=A0A6J1PXF0_9HYME